VSAPDDGLYRGDPLPQGHVPAHGPLPGHGPPAGYGPPPGYGWGPPPGYGWRRPTNTMAILALVFIFVFAPASLVFGLVARGQIRRTGEDGDGMALAGIIVGGLAVALIGLGLVFWIVALASISTAP
jgi:hypothetical protein